MGINRKLSTALALLISISGIESDSVKAQNFSDKTGVYSIEFDSNQTYIAEDFDNIFSENVKKYYNNKIDSSFFSYAVLLFNGRIIISPVGVINGEFVYDPFAVSTAHMCTIELIGNDLGFSINKDFFESKDNVDILNILKLVDIFSYLDLDINDSKFSKLKASLNGQKNLTVGEFIEIFKLMVPREMLPIKLEIPKVNINPTIPRFKEEFLNKPIDYRNFSLSMITDRKKNVPIYVDFLIINSDNINRNFFSFTYEYEYGNDKEKTKYMKNIGYKPKENDFSFTINDKIQVLKMIGKYFPLLSEPLANCETYGDLLEVYQMLPLEVQRQYKESDFKDNPYVDNSSSLNLPKKLEKLHS